METTRVCGALGPVDQGRLQRMRQLVGLEDAPVLLQSRHPSVVLHGSSACRSRSGATSASPAWVWSTATPVQGPGRTGSHHSWEDSARDDDVAGLECATEGTALLHASVSGAQPVYVEVTGDTVWFSTDLHALVASQDQPRSPDWTAWAQIIALGAPLEGRTTFAGIRRLQPMEFLRLTSAGAVESGRARWNWLDVEPEESIAREELTESILAALGRETSRRVEGPVHPMLSGGRDSRLLMFLADELIRSGSLSGPLRAWTTSSDTGTSLEELVAAQVAEQAGVRQRIVPARHDRFAADFSDYGRAVGFQASFHVWLMPVAQQLAATRAAEGSGTILDGLGGGVFLGGGFPDEPGVQAEGAVETGPSSSAEVVDSRLNRLTRYLHGAEELLAEGVPATLQQRSAEDFRRVAEPLASHPNGATLTAYLTRTLPGIGLAPAKVLGSSAPTATPIVTDSVVSQALRIPHGQKLDGAWYPHLLTHAKPQLEPIPTAADLTSRRQQVRRGASAEAARWYRNLLMESPAGALLSERMRAADEIGWQRQLEKTRPQHLLRSLALMALWLQEYEDQLTETEPHELLQGA